MKTINSRWDQVEKNHNWLMNHLPADDYSDLMSLARWARSRKELDEFFRLAREDWENR